MLVQPSGQGRGNGCVYGHLLTINAPVLWKSSSNLSRFNYSEIVH